MDVSTLVGIVLGFSLVIYGIGTGNLGNFLDVRSIAITLGGSIGAIIASFPFRVLSQVPKHLRIAFFGKRYEPLIYIDRLVELATFARQRGILALEQKANEEEDPFFKSSLLLIVDATGADKVRAMLTENLTNLTLRHQEAIAVYEKGAAFGPAFGMIGTLIGLINMLKGLNLSDGGGTNSLGNGMALALITTFYGSMFANVICMPIANKLQTKHEEELLCKEIVLSGVLAIQSGENPKYIREMLVSFLSQRIQERERQDGISKIKSRSRRRGK
jgi:chemotaxis protein MotA